MASVKTDTARPATRSVPARSRRSVEMLVLAGASLAFLFAIAFGLIGG